MIGRQNSCYNKFSKVKTERAAKRAASNREVKYSEAISLDLIILGLIRIIVLSVMNAVSNFVSFQQLMQLMSETWKLIFKSILLCSSSSSKISQQERLSL